MLGWLVLGSCVKYAPLVVPATAPGRGQTVAAQIVLVADNQEHNILGPPVKSNSDVARALREGEGDV